MNARNPFVERFRGYSRDRIGRFAPTGGGGGGGYGSGGRLDQQDHDMAARQLQQRADLPHRDQMALSDQAVEAQHIKAQGLANVHGPNRPDVIAGELNEDISMGRITAFDAAHVHSIYAERSPSVVPGSARVRVVRNPGAAHTWESAYRQKGKIAESRHEFTPNLPI